MNLEALALRRAEEQIESFKWQPEKPERPTIRRPLQGDLNSKRITCRCGECRTCKNREWMRAKRGGLATRAKCLSCGKRAPHDQSTGWCSLCRAHRPAQYREHAASVFSHGGGI